jgi:hypothetical protein
MSEEKEKERDKTVNLNTQGIGKPNLDTLSLELHRTQTLTLIWNCGSLPQPPVLDRPSSRWCLAGCQRNCGESDPRFDRCERFSEEVGSILVGWDVF